MGTVLILEYLICHLKEGSESASVRRWDLSTWTVWEEWVSHVALWRGSPRVGAHLQNNEGPVSKGRVVRVGLDRSWGTWELGPTGACRPKQGTWPSHWAQSEAMRRLRAEGGHAMSHALGKSLWAIHHQKILGGHEWHQGDRFKDHYSNSGKRGPSMIMVSISQGCCENRWSCVHINLEVCPA